MSSSTSDPVFEVSVTDGPVCETLVVAVANPGMAGVTAADHLVRSREAPQIGRVVSRGFASLTPFADGRPRHHTRLYDLSAERTTLLLGEVPLPSRAVEPFVSAVLDWATSPRGGVETVTVLTGIPFAHAPEEHAVFGVGTDNYREEHLDDTDVENLRGGVLDGVAGETLGRALDTGLSAGTLVTPTHPPGPDLDAAVLFLEALASVHGVAADVEELRQRSAELKQHYAELSDRLAAAREDRDGYPEDRAFM